MIRYIFAMLSLLMLTFGVWAQTSDSTAYRLFFVAVTADRADQQGMKVEHIELPGSTHLSGPVSIDPKGGPSIRQLGYLKNAGLSDRDAVTARQILAKFRLEYDALVTEYNNLPETIAGTNDATPAFLSRLENLTQSTKYVLSTSLSSFGVTSLDSHIRGLTVSDRPIAKQRRSGFTPVAFHTSSQSGCVMTPHYDWTKTFSYSSIPPPYTDAAFLTVLTEGYASTSGNCAGVWAKGFARAQFLTDCYTSTLGPATSPTSWISVSDLVEVYNPNGQLCSNCGMTSADVYTNIGKIFAQDLIHFSWEIAFTRFLTAGYILDTSGIPHFRDYFVGSYCTRETTPPDWNPASPPLYWITYDPPGVPDGVVDGKTFCARVGASGTPWTCLPFGRFLTSYSAPYVTGVCTHVP